MHNEALSLAALKYAAGAMDSVDEAAFEMKLADDPNARDALEEIVQLSAAAIGQPAPTPDPLFRQAVLERLRPVQTWVGSLFARRPYRGHPLTWSGAGAGVTAAAAVAIWSVMPAPQQSPILSNTNSIAILPAEKPISINGGGGESDVRTNRPSTLIPTPPVGNPLNPLGDG